MKNVSTFFLLTLVCFFIQATATIPDSLKARVDSLKAFLNDADIEKPYAAEFGIAWELGDVDNAIAVIHAGRAYTLAQSVRDTAWLIKSGRFFGQLLRRTDQPDSAVSIFHDVTKLAEYVGDSVELGRMVNAMAVLYIYQGRFDLALVNCLRAVTIRRALHDSVGTARSLSNTGLSFYRLENYNEAMRCYKEALELADDYGLPNLLMNIALVKVATKDSAGFIRFAAEAMLVAQTDERDQISASYHFAFGCHFQKYGQLDSAVNRFRLSWRVADRLGDTRTSVESQLRIAQYFGYRAEYDSVLAILGNIGDKQVAAYPPLQLIYYDIMGVALERKGQIHAALRYRNLHKVLNDSIADRRITNNILMARVKFEEERSNLVIAKQSEIIRLNARVIDRQNLLLIVATALALALLSIVLLLLRFSRYQKGIAAELDRKVLERTRDLQMSEGALVRKLSEQKALMDLISARLHSSIATVKGLWSIKTSSSESATLKQEFEVVAVDLLQVSKLIDRNRGIEPVLESRLHAVIE